MGEELKERKEERGEGEKTWGGGGEEEELTQLNRVLLFGSQLRKAQ